MIAELGLAVLWMAAALAVLQLVAGALALRPQGAAMRGVVRPVAVMQGVLVALAFAALITLFITTDLSVKLVAENSHSAKPLIFKIAGTWGNHEGSMLLWVTIMSLAGAFVALVEKRLAENTLLATLAAQAFVSLGFYAFLLLSSNPFARLPQPAPEGAGLNPLLQDIGLAFHPPTLYVGYVGLSIAFSFAVGALITRDVGPAFARAMRPWVLGAWIFLTVGITAGSYWAYYTLGWGGWWFWDPVENASLMPWLAATALLHSVSVLAARNALRAWTVMLGVIAFSMSMVGTFLVRSGILTSVHAFAVDPARGSFILALLAIYIGGALLLFALRAGTVTEGARFAFVSREAALVFNNVMLCGIPRHRAGRHALSAADRGVRRQGFGGAALFQPGLGDLCLPHAGGHGGRPAAALEGRSRRARGADPCRAGAGRAGGWRGGAGGGRAPPAHAGPRPWGRARRGQPAASARAQPAAHAAADLGHGGQPPGPGRGGDGHGQRKRVLDRDTGGAQPGRDPPGRSLCADSIASIRWPARTGPRSRPRFRPATPG
jgi:hypothetical protein